MPVARTLRPRAFRAALAFILSASVGLLAACEPSRSANENRLWTPTYFLRVTSEPVRPRAEEVTRYKIVVVDKKTNEPIQSGEGRIFATNADKLNVDNGLSKGKEVGTYYGDLRFLMSGDWSIAIQFRRINPGGVQKDTLEQTLDWRTSVLSAPPLEQHTKKQ